jgi:hypothetical protein
LRRTGCACARTLERHRYRRRKSLEKCLEEAKAQVERLAQELDEDPGATSKRQQAAKKRAVRERAERVQRALDQLPDVQAAKERSAKKADREKAREAARVPTTDPDARVMKMAYGGFRPAMNVQFAVDTASQVVVGVDVTNRGSDLGELPPMLDQIAERHGTRPEEILVDGGFVKLKDFETVSREPYNCTVYAPVQKPRDASRDPHEPRPTDGPAAQEWRRRMGTDEAKEVYKQRGATVECVNAIARNRGFTQFPLRGLEAAKSVALIFAIAHNVARTIALAA